MRLLISTSTFPIRTDDGLPRFVFDLAEALAEHHEVNVLTPGAAGAPRHERMGPLDVHRFTYFLPRTAQLLAYGHGMRDNMRQHPVARLQPLTYIATQVGATRRLIREKRVQAVNSHWMVPQGLSTGLALGRRRSCGHLLTVHAADVYMLQRTPAGSKMARFIAKRSDAVFADGSHVRDSLDNLLGHESGAELQPNGVRTGIFRGHPDLEPVASPFPDGYLLFFGRFAEKKGVVYLLRAMPRVLETHPGLGLILIGYGTLEGELRGEAGRLGIDRSVEFLGRQPHPEIVRHLHSCRMAVVPSIIDSRGETEGMPTVVVEAMAAGVRVVGSAVDGIPDVIKHRQNGWLCREKDPDDLAEKILEALAESASSPITDAALQTAAGLDWSEVAANYTRCLESIVRQTDVHRGREG